VIYTLLFYVSKSLFYRQIGLKRENSEIWSITFVALKTGHFGKHIRNTVKVFKCGGGEGLRRSGGPIE